MTIEERALALVNEVAGFGYLVAGDFMDDDQDCLLKALCRALEAHDATLAELAAKDAELNAYKREVSDEAERILNCTNVNKRYAACLSLNRLIIPEPVDPLFEAMVGKVHEVTAVNNVMISERAAQAIVRGIKLVEVGDAD